MNRSINFLSLGLILALGACSVSNDEQKRQAISNDEPKYEELPSNLEQSQFAKSVRGKAVFTQNSDMQLFFNEIGTQARIIAGQPLNSDKYEYTLIETVSDTVAIYSVEVSTGKNYVVFKISSPKLMKSALLNDLKKAQDIADSNESDKDLHEYGSLIRPADPSITTLNPFIIMREIFFIPKHSIETLKKSIIINGEKVSVKDNGDIIYKGKELSLMSVTVDKATIADSRQFVGKYYDVSTSSVPQFYLSIEPFYFDINNQVGSPDNFVGLLYVTDQNGVHMKGMIKFEPK